jgi:hypothetical protein
MTDENMSVSTTDRGDFSSFTIKSDASWVGDIATILNSFPSVGRSGKVYASVWKRISSADDYTTAGGGKENWKFVRFWPGASSGNYPNLVAFQTVSGGACTGGGSHRFYVEQAPSATHAFNDSDYAFPSTTWMFEEWLIQFNSSNGALDGKLRIYQNGTLVVTRDTFAQDWSSQSDDSLQAFYFQHDPANLSNCSGSNPTYDVYYDDAVYDYGSGSWARVLLANNATLASATHIEYQPATAWSDTSITFTQRFGSFAATDTVYAHLCDADNSCTTTGQQVTSGGNPAPTVTSVVPSTANINATQTVVVHGTGILASAEVVIGTSAATGESVLTSTAISCVIPARASTGTVNVTITNTDAQVGTLINGFTYVPSSPTVSNISPSSGSELGGTLVTLTGTNMTHVISVTFGGTAATNETITSDTEMTCVTPAGTTGARNVVLTTSFDTSATVTNGYTYTAEPVLAEVACPCVAP